MNEKVDVLEALASWCNEKNIGKAEYEKRSLTYAAVTELIESDREYDRAIAEHKEIVRHIAEQGWFEVKFDALRKAGERTDRAQARRFAALANIGDTK